MDDIFMELVEYEAWDMALQFLSEHQYEFKKNLSEIPIKKGYRLALRLNTLIQHISETDIKKIYEQEFGNFIYFNIQPKSQYTLQFYQKDLNDLNDSKESDNTNCKICMDTFEYNDLIVCCKLCHYYLGHYNCCETWYSTICGKNKPNCPNCKK